MKPRIEKKLSKKLATILAHIQGFTPKDVWIDTELELFPIHYALNNNGVLTPKQKRRNYEQKVRVNNMPSIGGELDYWGEGTDFFSVLTCARETLPWSMFEIKPFDVNTMEGGYPIITMKLTGKNMIALARAYAARKSSQKAHRAGR